MRQRRRHICPDSRPSGASQATERTTNLSTRKLHRHQPTPIVANLDLDLHKPTTIMTALFNFQSLLLVILLTICTSTYAHSLSPGVIDRNKDNYFVSPFWKAARVGERLSPYVSLACVIMAALEFMA